MSSRARTREIDVQVPAEDVMLPAILGMPEAAVGVVLFAHGSGSGRLSPRNNAVAHVLQDAGLGTLLADLLTEDEAQDRRFVFDIGLLSRRLGHCTSWAGRDERTKDLPMAYFGASTGAAAALVAAAQIGPSVRAVVSRGGRPDLAGDYLAEVQSPTVFIVGGDDVAVIPLNEEAFERLHSIKKLVVVPGATHLFEEAGKLGEVALLARDWFLEYVPGS